MNRRNIGGLAMTVLAASILSILPALIAQNPDKAETALKAAMDREVVDGNLKLAVEQYKKLAQGQNKSVAARALVRLGECYEKQGNAEARQAYEQVLSRYGDQKEAVEQARARLAALGAGKLARRQTTTLVWSGPKAGPEGTISPDGRYLSYPDWDTGNLALHDFVSGTDRLLTSDGTWKGPESAFAEDSAISRDGKQVAYARYQGKNNRFELRVVNTTGDPKPRSVFESPDMRYISPKDWSPDGKWIAVSLEPENSDARTNQTVQPGTKAALGLVGAQDGSLRVVKTTEWTGPDSGFGKILLSPDGKYLAYDRPTNAASRQRGVFVLALGADREIPIAAGAAQQQLAAWSPDGKYLLFTSNRTGTNGLWAIAFANGMPLGEPLLVKPDIGRISSVGLSASGALYYYLEVTRDLPRVQTATFDFGTGQLLSQPADLTHEGDAEGSSSPDWSPDGKQIAYVSQTWAGFGPEFSIKIRTIETGQVRELRPGRLHPSYLKWAPDGRSLLVQEDNYNALSRVDAQSGETSLLIKPERGLRQFSPVLSPDGKTLYYSRRQQGPNTDTAFVELDLASGKEREIIRRLNLGGLNLSPDGRYIATASMDPSDRSSTFIVIPIDGGAPRDAMRGPGGALTMLTWAPDSRSVLIRKRLGADDGDVELWQGFVDGSEPRKLDGKLDPRLARGGIRLHPDERRIALIPPASPRSSSQKSPAQIMVLENFLPVASAITGK